MVLGLIFVPATWPFLLGSFLLARATVAMMAEREKELGWQRWLIYPPLVIVYLPIFVVLIAWPALAGGLAAELADDRSTNPFNGQPWRDVPDIPFIISMTATALSAWWSLLLAAVMVWPALPMHVFRPFIGRARRAVALLLLIVCLVIFGFSTVALSDIVNHQQRRTPPPYQPPVWEQQQPPPQRPDGTQRYQYQY
jgi:hypothetical protein